jgi:radical SAM superfamily enzyme YgiQ (UPF0313 family)
VGQCKNRKKEGSTRGLRAGTRGVDLFIVFPNNRLRAFGTLASDIAAITPPVESGLIASYLRERGYSVRLLDADAEGVMPEEVAVRTARVNPRLVLVSTDQVNTGDVTKMAAAGDTARSVKKETPHIPVMMFGNVPSAYPERILREESADFVCQGEPYEPIDKLLSTLKERGASHCLDDNEVDGIWARYDDRIVSSRHANRFSNIDELPYPAWDMMPPTNYRAHHWHCFDRLQNRTPYAAIFTNMGCPYTCTFCCVNVAAGGPNLRLHTPEYVCGEIDMLVKRYGVKNIRILDNVFTAKMDRVEKLCDLIGARWQDLNLWAYARVDSIRDPDILPKMKRAGINWLAYGFEAAHDRVRAAVHKGTKTPTTEAVIDWTRKAGIHIVANFIFGLPEDDLTSMQMTLDMAKTYQFEWVNFYCAMAYPGTKLYEQARRDNVALPRTWSGYSQYSPDSLPLSTKRLTSKEVLSFRDHAFREYYTDSGYQHMMRKEFGENAVEFVKRILSHEIKRNP